MYQSECEQHGEVCLTVFSPTASAVEEFRACFRRDIAVLANLDSSYIVQPVDWGDIEGQLYFCTAPWQGSPLSDQLNEGLPLRPDELLDLSWQIASAVQQLHNAGLICGNVSPAHVLLQPSFKCRIILPCVSEWLSMVTVNTASQRPTFAERAADDLRDTGQLLQTLLDNCTPDAADDRTAASLAGLVELASRLIQNPETLTARDVQRLTGSMLLDLSGDAIEVRYERAAGNQADSDSIICELFDEEGPSAETQKQQPPASTNQTSAAYRLVLALAGLAILIFLIWAVGLLT